ncbi:cobalamin-binding protein [bacterium]|nr:MAG: cobalamin-binding protein [bacterium]
MGATRQNLMAGFLFMKRILYSILFVLFCLAVFSYGCADEANPRYISLAPSTTEILFALGLNDEIVGVSSFCDYPAQAKAKEKAGSFSQPNFEKILSLKPDYIFCTGLKQSSVFSQLIRLNLNVYVSDPKNIEELFDSIIEIGKITKKIKEAQGLVDRMRKEIAEVVLGVNRIAQEKKPKIFIEIWSDPLMTAGKGSLVDELFTLAGGINIAGDLKKSYSIFSPEEVIRKNPDFIFLTYMDKEKTIKSVRGRFGWGQISAIKNNRLYNDIDPAILLRPGPRLVEGIKAIHKRLYCLDEKKPN